jgi:geranylgeranyl reductase family protein
MKIAVVGGGPAGAYLGYCLAREGIEAMIFDDSHPREKPCGGGISSLAIKKFPILHGIPCGKARDTKIRLISPKGREAIAEGVSESWAVSRKHLDSYLLKRAVDEGAEHSGERVVDFSRDGKGWKVRTSKRTFRADLLVGADGANSLVRKKLVGPIPKENLGICFGCFASGPTDETTVIRFLEGMEGYAWIFPREDHFSIGIGVEMKHGKTVRSEFEKFMKAYAGHAKPFSTWAAVLPLIKDPKFFEVPTSGEGWLLIGDAAGHVDPITGEGITYALWSAEIAAEAIVHGEIGSYESRWRHAYGRNLRKGCEMRGMFFNGLALELSIWLASRSKTFGKSLYEMINSDQDYGGFDARVVKELPKILWEVLR